MKWSGGNGVLEEGYLRKSEYPHRTPGSGPVAHEHRQQAPRPTTSRAGIFLCLPRAMNRIAGVGAPLPTGCDPWSVKSSQFMCIQTYPRMQNAEN